jgi:hypothetical protein
LFYIPSSCVPYVASFFGFINFRLCLRYSLAFIANQYSWIIVLLVLDIHNHDTFSSVYSKVVVCNPPFNNIAVISWRPASLVGKTWRKPHTCLNFLTNFITWYCIEYTSQWAEFELTILTVIYIDCTGSCKFNYNTITTTTTPFFVQVCDTKCVLHYYCFVNKDFMMAAIHEVWDK